MVDVTLIVDVRELRCPMPLLKAKQGLSKIEIGDIVKVLTSDPQSLSDFQAFAKLSKNELLEYLEEDGVFSFVLRKG